MDVPPKVLNGCSWQFYSQVTAPFDEILSFAAADAAMNYN